MRRATPLLKFKLGSSSPHEHLLIAFFQLDSMEAYILSSFGAPTSIGLVAKLS